MRTLKKALCLVLALSMVFSLGIFSVSAESELTDIDEIEHREAVEVLNYIGVITGRSTGAYDPTATLTRAEGCALVTRLLNANVPEATSPFTDVGHNTMEKYIAYCYGLGIVAGRGDGTFDPSGTLTGSAFAKMLLCGLGYDAEIEGLLGPTWQIGVAKLVRNISLDEGLKDLNLTEDLTRDSAAQFAFNALQASMVYYDSSVSTSSDGTTGTSTSIRAQYKTDVKNPARNNISGSNTIELGESSYPTLKKTSTINKYGELYIVWKDGIDEIVAGDVIQPIKVYTDKQWSVATDLRGYDLQSAKVYVNSTAYDITADTGLVANLTGNGVEVRLYVEDQTTVGSEYKVTDIVALSTYVAEIVGKDASAKTITLAVDLFGNSTPVTTLVDTKTHNTSFYDEINAFAKGDHIKIYAKGNYSLADGFDIQAVLGEADVITGNVTDSVTATNGITTYTIGGKEYKLSDSSKPALTGGGRLTQPTLSSLAVETTKYNFFLDNYGYISASKVSDDSTNYAYVVDVDKDGSRGEYTYYLNLAFTDGTKDWVKVAAYNGATTATKLSDLYKKASNELINNSALYVSYSEGADGYDVTLYPDTANANPAVFVNWTNEKPQIKKGNTEFKPFGDTGTTYTLTNNTALLVQNDDGTFKATKGISNIATQELGDDTSFLYTQSKSVIAIVSKNTTSYLDKLVYVVEQDTSKDAHLYNNVTVNTYKAIVDGSLTTIEIKADEVSNKTFYGGSNAIKINAAKGYIESANAVTPTETLDVTNATTATQLTSSSNNTVYYATSGSLYTADGLLYLTNGDPTATGYVAQGNTALLGSNFQVYTWATGKDTPVLTDIAGAKNYVHVTAGSIYIVMDGSNNAKYAIVTGTFTQPKATN